METDEEPIRIPVSDVFDLHSIAPCDVKEAVERIKKVSVRWERAAVA